ncbi:MAG: serine hydrolase [Pirellulaceae bacterium]
MRFIVILYLAIASNVATQAQVDISNVLQPLINSHQGDVAVAVALLNQDNEIQIAWSHNGDRVMPTASLIKLPVMIEAYRQAATGLVSLDTLLTLDETDKVPGSGILSEHFSAGAQLPLRDAIRLMVRYSDNTATNLVLDVIGLDSTAIAMNELGYPETQIHSKVYRRDTSINLERSKKYGLGSTTANDMVDLLVRLERCELGSTKDTEAMRTHLLSCDDTGRFPRFLPSGTPVAHKTGAVNRTRTAAGIIYAPSAKIVLCVLTDNNKDESWTNENAAHLLCANLAKAAFDFAQRTVRNSDDAQPDASVSEVLRIGNSGELVETLQRTLNAKFDFELSEDGDFGPATEAAVREFQTAHSLPITGTVNAETWGALGELVFGSDVSVADPEVVNAETLPLDPLLDPHAAPQVTARAYTVVETETGIELSSFRANERLPNASTTKLMTAYVVLDLARKRPELLDETVTISLRAANTGGSSSGLRAGEQLPVSELLYGLLLPSGNDASVALAEHVGQELGTGDPYDAFIDAMNEYAKKLQLLSTHFVNPHGLTTEDHYSSAFDLAKLARAALELPMMRELVSCRQHGCRVTSVDGYSRNVIWYNTNRLLRQEGFKGLKTGTTSAAGACLVAFGERDGKSRVVVVLGCANSDARYADARNLFAWSWREGPAAR